MKLLTIAAASLCLATGAAQATTLLCTVKQSASQGGWIAEQILLEYDLAAGTGTALDGITEHYAGGKVDATVSGKEETKVALSWKVLGKDISGQQTNMQYRASWFPAKNQVIVRMSPGAGFGNRFEGRGTCTVK